MARADHDLLLGADLQHLAHGRQHRAVPADDLDPLRRVLEVLHVMVGVEGGEPYYAPEPTLHPPHPLDRLGVDSAHGRVEHDAAEHLHARDVLADEPRAVCGEGDVIFEHERLKAVVAGERHGLVVVD